MKVAGADDTEMADIDDTERGTIEAGDTKEEAMGAAGSKEDRAAADDTDNDDNNKDDTGDSVPEVDSNGAEGSESGVYNGESERDRMEEAGRDDEGGSCSAISEEDGEAFSLPEFVAASRKYEFTYVE